MNFVKKLCLSLFATLVAVSGASSPGSAQQQPQRPNIVAIMGDDIGWFNIGAYHRGIMAGRTPNLDQLASEGCCSLTTTPRRAARPAVPTSLLANCRSAPA
jgi:arylsulfatase A-like enzyme